MCSKVREGLSEMLEQRPGWWKEVRQRVSGSFTHWVEGTGCEAGEGRGCPKGHEGRAKVVLGVLRGALASKWSHDAV